MARFKPSVLGLGVECSTIVLQGHTSGHFHKTFLGIIYTAFGHTYGLHLDSGYATRGVNYIQKSLMKLIPEILLNIV